MDIEKSALLVLVGQEELPLDYRHRQGDRMILDMGWPSL